MGSWLQGPPAHRFSDHPSFSDDPSFSGLPNHQYPITTNRSSDMSNPLGYRHDSSTPYHTSHTDIIDQSRYASVPSHPYSNQPDTVHSSSLPLPMLASWERVSDEPPPRHYMLSPNLLPGPPQTDGQALNALLNPQAARHGNTSTNATSFNSYPDMPQPQTARFLLQDRYIQSAASSRHPQELSRQTAIGSALSTGTGLGDARLPVPTLTTADLVTGTTASVSSATLSGVPPKQPHLYLPKTLALADNKLVLTSHQVLLRLQIEVFQATEEDLKAPARGRNKRVQVGQVGIRCRHCKNKPASRRQRGSMYFPHSTMGIYQAAQNMSSTHLQCGLCIAMPEALRQQFADLIPTKATGSLVGRPYWTQSAREMGLVDTDEGIRFVPN
jgi:hypothetical protein